MSVQHLATQFAPGFDAPLLPDQFSVKAGFYTVKTITQRNNIKAAYRKLDGFSNTLVFVSDTNRLYKLINEPGTSTTTDLDWEEIILGTEGGVEPVGEWDPTLNSPALTDAGALNRNGEFYFVINAGTGYNFLDPDLFEGALTEVFNGDWIISVGDKWTVLRPTVTWDQITKPQSIVDYVAGTVIAHNHIIGDITGLQTALDVKYDVDDTADHTADFNTVPDADIVEVEFLKTHYYRRSEVDAAISSLGSAITFLSLTDTPSTFETHGSKLVRVNALATGLEFITTSSIVTWANLSGQPTTLAGYGITDAAVTFTNGLTRTVNNVKWGGALEDATTLISGADGTKALHLGGDGVVGGINRLSALEVRANYVDMKTSLAITLDSTAGLNLNASGAAGQITIDAGPNGPQLLLNTTTATFLDRRLLKKGWEYSGDYSAGYTLRSLPDKNYADTHLMGKLLPASPGLAQNEQALRWNNAANAWEFYNPSPGGGGGGGGGGTTYSFQNGLTESGGIVRLGGPLTEASTTIDIGDKVLGLEFTGIFGGDGLMTLGGDWITLRTYEAGSSTLFGDLGFSNGNIVLIDGKAVKTGLQYSEAGYETTDLTLITRGYANVNYWNDTGSFNVTDPVINGKPTFSLLGALDTARTNFITASVGGTLGVSLLAFRHNSARTTADGFADVFLGPNNGNASSPSGGNIVIGQNNLNALVTSGTWLGTPYFSTFRGDRNIVLGFNIANQWTTPTVGNESSSNIIMGQHTASGTTKGFSFGVVLGHESLKDTVSAATKWESMIAIGTYTLRSATFNAGVDNTRDNITAIGAFVGYNAVFADGFGSTLIGNSSGRDAVFLEDYQVLIGGAGRGASLGRANIGIGERALWGALGGSAGSTGVGTNQFNVAVGIHTMEGAGPSEKGTYVGTEAGQGVVIGQKNTGYGSWSLNRVNGHHNMGIGPYAGYMAANTITGSGNAFFGPSTGLATTTVNVSNVMVIANPSAVTATGGYRPAAVSDTIYIGSVGDILFRNDYAGTPKDTLSLKKDGSVAIANALKTTIGVNNTVSTITGSYNFLVGLDMAISGVAGAGVHWSNLIGEAGTIVNNKSGTTVNNAAILGGYLNNITSHALTGGANQFGSIYNPIIVGAQSVITNEFATGPMTAPMVIGYNGHVQADLGQAMGYYTLIKNTGKGGFAHGFVTTTADFGNHTGVVERVTVGGKHAVNISANSTAQTVGHGAYGDYSVILGGYDHDIPTTSLRSVVLGGNAIKVAASVLDTVHMPKVRIGLGTGGALATDVANDNLLVRDAITGEVKTRTANFWTTNGTTTLLGDVIIGLTENVLTNFLLVDGSLTTAGLQLNQLADGKASVLLAGHASGGIPAHTFILDANNIMGYGTGAILVDETASPTGLKYGGDYKATLVDLSLIHKGFANANYWKVTGTTTLPTGSTQIQAGGDFGDQLKIFSPTDGFGISGESSLTFYPGGMLLRHNEVSADDVAVQFDFNSGFMNATAGNFTTGQTVSLGFGSNGLLTIGDNKTVKTGLQYSQAGYETTDLSLISRGYANTNYWKANATTALTASTYVNVADDFTLRLGSDPTEARTRYSYIEVVQNTTASNQVRLQTYNSSSTFSYTAMLMESQSGTSNRVLIDSATSISNYTRLQLTSSGGFDFLTNGSSRGTINTTGDWSILGTLNIGTQGLSLSNNTSFRKLSFSTDSYIEGNSVNALEFRAGKDSSVADNIYSFLALGNYSNTTSTTTIFQIEQGLGSFNPASGTSNFTAFSVVPNPEITGTHTGIVRGFHYQLAFGATLAAGTKHYAIETLAGDIIFRGGHALLTGSAVHTLTASTRLDVRGVSSGNIVRFATDGNVEKFRIDNNGSLIASLSSATFSTDFNYSAFTVKVPQLDISTPAASFSATVAGVNAGEYLYKRRAAFGGFLSWPDTDITTYHTADHSTTDTPNGSSVRIPDNASSLVTVKIVARRTGGTAGAANDSAAYVLKGLFKKVAGTVTQIGSTVKEVVGESQAAWDANLVAVATDVFIITTSAADNTVDWNFEIEVMRV